MGRRRVDLQTADGTLDVYTFQPDRGEGPWPAVIVYMDAFGIRPNLDSMAQRLASHGYFVVVPNLYYRTGPFAPFNQEQVVEEGPERDRFKGMIGSIDHAKVLRDTAAVIAHLATEPAVRRGAIGVVGYCMGGGYALSAAATFPDRVAVAASFHGGSLATDKPDSPHRLVKQIRGKVYVGAAEFDPSFPEEQRQRLEQSLKDAGLDYTLEVYEGARHGFAVTGHRVYDRDASERHWLRLVDLLGVLGSDPRPGRLEGQTLEHGDSGV